MSDTSPPDRSRVPLPAELQQAIEAYKEWTNRHLLSEQNNSAVSETLYHYTDMRGLKGILEAGQIWFTDYRHLNDPSELTHGIDMARDVAHQIATGADGRVRLFLDYFLDLFRHDNFVPTLEFFIACFSRARDDLGQWRAYADNGRGVAIGLSPSLFAVTDTPAPGQLPEFVGPVRYSLADVCGRHEACLEEAAAIFLAAANANANLLANKTIGIPFMDQFVREIIASPLIWNCLTSKHPAYEHEQEVRLVMMGMPATVSPFVTTRFRGSEIVPYIAQPMPLRVEHKIAEIVVGPAAPRDTERTVRAMLRSIGIGWDFPISRSDIPYRAP